MSTKTKSTAMFIKIVSINFFHFYKNVRTKSSMGGKDKKKNNFATIVATIIIIFN